MSEIRKMLVKHKSLRLIKMEREAFFSPRPFLRVHAPFFSLKKDARFLDDTPFFFSLLTSILSSSLHSLLDLCLP